jgi:hypothetical protein
MNEYERSHYTTEEPLYADTARFGGYWQIVAVRDAWSKCTKIITCPLCISAV